MLMEKVAALCALDGVSGCETEVREAIRAEAARYAGKIETDVLGNLIVFKKGGRRPKKTVMLAAHMDEVGFINKRINDDGTLEIGATGGIDRRVIMGKRVRVGEKRLPGVIGSVSVHLTTPEARKSVPKMENLYVDIGAKDKAEAEKHVEIGDPVAFDTAPEFFGDGRFKAKAIDDRLGCAVLLDLMAEALPWDCYFVFTVQEEVGLRGAGPVAHRLAPDICLIVEGTTAADLPGMPDHKRACRVGGGAVLPFMDRGTFYDRELFEHLCGLARGADIPFQLKDYIAGGTDAGAIQRSVRGVRVAAVSAPVRYIHSPAGVASVGDMRAVRDLVRRFIHDGEGMV
ncbi:M42 family metallopeptidase [Oscillospiraceae bacterium OttesenSCG-928-F05]|nr:M42 family metallopeptidase [Oscillospiraceae bacterium OttesenSCG-928-F05]